MYVCRWRLGNTSKQFAKHSRNIISHDLQPPIAKLSPILDKRRHNAKDIISRRRAPALLLCCWPCRASQHRAHTFCEANIEAWALALRTLCIPIPNRLTNCLSSASPSSYQARRQNKRYDIKNTSAYVCMYSKTDASKWPDIIAACTHMYTYTHSEYTSTATWTYTCLCTYACFYICLPSITGC